MGRKGGSGDGSMRSYQILSNVEGDTEHACERRHGHMGGAWGAWRCNGQIHQDPWDMHALHSRWAGPGTRSSRHGGDSKYHWELPVDVLVLLHLQSIHLSRQKPNL